METVSVRCPFPWAGMDSTLGVGGVGSCGHKGVNNYQGDVFLPLDWGIVDPIGFDLPGEALFKTGASLCVGGFLVSGRPYRR